jgi:hypothetical protein
MRPHRKPNTSAAKIAQTTTKRCRHRTHPWARPPPWRGRGYRILFFGRACKAGADLARIPPRLWLTLAACRTYVWLRSNARVARRQRFPRLHPWSRGIA